MGPEGNIEKNTVEQGFSMEEANSIQMELIKKSGEKPEQWIDNKAKEFRKIIEANPFLAEMYREDPEAAEKIIEEVLNRPAKETYH